MPKKTEAQIRAQQTYMQKMALYQIRTDKEHFEAIRAHADRRGESVNGFINRAIDETMERDERGGNE